MGVEQPFHVSADDRRLLARQIERQRGTIRMSVRLLVGRDHMAVDCPTAPRSLF
jgi:hypothetical protein